jgi:hypothetical protein
MQPNFRFLVLAAVSSALLTPALLAQSTPAAPDQPATQQTQPTQDATSPAQNAPSQDPSSGVSQPPPDSSIHADEDLPAPAPTPKPRAAVPVAPPPAAAAPPMPAPPVERQVGRAANSEYAGQVDNTDSGIVTVVAVPGSSPAPLQARQPDADYGVATNVPFNPNDLPEGTNIPVRLSQPLSTSDTEIGTPFKAVVTRNVYNGGNLIIPIGSEMRGRITYVSQGHHVGPHATLRLRPEAVILPDGTAYHLYAQVAETDANGTRTDDEGGIQTTTHYKKDAVEYGAAAGTGAIVGGVVAGPIGAGVGTLVGAGAVTTHMLLQNPQAVRLPEGTLLVFSLTQPMNITPTKN